MFKRKQAAKIDNEWTLKYKTRWDAASNAMKRLQGQVGNTETAVRCFDLYPCCGEMKTEALKRRNAAQEKLLSRAKEYDLAIAAVKDYYAANQEKIEVDWHPSQWKSAHEVIEFAYRNIHDLYYQV